MDREDFDLLWCSDVANQTDAILYINLSLLLYSLVYIYICKLVLVQKCRWPS